MHESRNAIDKKVDGIQRELEIKTAKNTTEIEEIKNGMLIFPNQVKDLAKQVKDLKDSTNAIKKDIEDTNAMQKEIQDIMKSEDAVKEAIENYRKFSNEVRDLERLGNKVNQIEQNIDIRIKDGFKCIEDEINNIED